MPDYLLNLSDRLRAWEACDYATSHAMFKRACNRLYPGSQLSVADIACGKDLPCLVRTVVGVADSMRRTFPDLPYLVGVVVSRRECGVVICVNY